MGKAAGVSHGHLAIASIFEIAGLVSAALSIIIRFPGYPLLLH